MDREHQVVVGIDFNQEWPVLLQAVDVLAPARGIEDQRYMDASRAHPPDRQRVSRAIFIVRHDAIAGLVGDVDQQIRFVLFEHGEDVGPYPVIDTELQVLPFPRRIVTIHHGN